MTDDDVKLPEPDAITTRYEAVPPGRGTPMAPAGTLRASGTVAVGYTAATVRRLAAEVEALRADAALSRFIRARVTECHNGWAIAQTFIHGAPSLEDVTDAIPAIDAAKAKDGE